MNVLFVQYAGDFCEAYNRLIVSNKQENYYGQVASVSTVVELARSGKCITVLTVKCRVHNQTLEPNLKSIGVDKDSSGYAQIYEIIDNGNFDKAVVRLPDFRIFKRLRNQKIECLPLFADSFPWVSWREPKSFIRHIILKRELQKGFIEWASNHQVNACNSLLTLGLSASKVLPYDHEHTFTPDSWSSSSNLAANRSNSLNLFYAGALIESKGVIDLLKAVQILQKCDIKVRLNIAGGQSDLDLSKISSSLNLEGLQLLGKIDHNEVLEQMYRADFVVVPSHHVYPEGLPMTIMESLMVGTPVIASDHPMFVGRTGRAGSVKFFNAERPHELASLIALNYDDKVAYNRMQEATGLEWNLLTLQLTWSKLVEQWVCESQQDFSEHSLANILNQMDSVAEAAMIVEDHSDFFERNRTSKLTGVVVIGRNEGDRLRKCLSSLNEHYPDVACVYVDSLSTDGSLELANSMGIDSVSIGRDRSPSAALGRNIGAEYLIEKHPKLEFIQFLDGDSELQKGWLEQAGHFLTINKDIAIVSGDKSEQYDQQTLFGTLNGLEWKKTSGVAVAVPGDMLIRISTFQCIGGFNSSIIAAEDDDLCLRAAENGEIVYRLNVAMSQHYGGLTTLRQWLRRSVRTGYAYANLFHLKRGRYFGKNVFSSVLWGAILPVLVSLFTAFQLFPLSALLVGSYGLMAAKIALQPRLQHLSRYQALAYGCLTMISKFAEVIGVGKYILQLASRSKPKVIEYK